MNNKMMVDDMLIEFAESFAEFREEFHNIVNEVQNNDIRYDRSLENPNETAIKEEIGKAKFQIEYDERRLQDPSLSEVERSQTQDRINFNKELIENKNKELEEMGLQSKQSAKENVDRLKGYRDALKEAIKKMREAVKTIEVNGKTVSNIDVIKNDINTQLNVIEFNIESTKKRLYEAKGSEKGPIIRELQELVARRKQLMSLFNSLTSFVSILEKMERKYINGNAYVDIYDLFSDSRGYDNLFEELADSLGNRDNLNISINIIKNDDGTYSIDMRCGNKFAEPRPILNPNELTKENIDKLLLGFAGAIARKSDFSEDLVKASDVLIKSNGEEIGTFPFGEVGKTIQEKEIGMGDPEKGQDAPAQDAPAQDAPAQDAPAQDAPAQDAPAQDAPAQDAPAQDAPAQDVPAQDTPAQGTPSGNNQPSDNTKAAEMYRVMESKKATRRTLGAIGILAGTVLGLASIGGAPLTVPALIAIGAGTGFNALNIYDDLKIHIKRKSIERKLKKLAKSVNCELRYDYQNRTAAFYKLDEDKQPTDVKVESQDIPVMDALYHINLEEELNRMFNNAHRGVASAVTATDYQYQGFTKVTVDKLEAAFEEYYGILTPEELNAKYEFNLKHLFDRSVERTAPEEVEELSAEEAEELLTDETPAQDAPAQDAPAQDAPAQEAPAQEAPAQDAPAQEAPAQDAPAQDAPAQDAPAQDAPAQDAPAQDAPAQDAPAQDAPAQDAPAQDAPAQEAPAQDAPAQDAPAQDAPAPDAPAQDELDDMFEDMASVVTEGLAAAAARNLEHQEIVEENNGPRL